MNFYDYADVYLDRTNNRQFKGVSYPINFLQYKQFFQVHEITKEQQYRPDKIAYSLTGSDSRAWILDVINGFTHGIREYTAGRKIFYLPEEKLINLGL